NNFFLLRMYVFWNRVGTFSLPYRFLAVFGCLYSYWAYSSLILPAFHQGSSDLQIALLHTTYLQLGSPHINPLFQQSHQLHVLWHLLFFSGLMYLFHSIDHLITS